MRENIFFASAAFDRTLQGVHQLCSHTGMQPQLIPNFICKLFQAYSSLHLYPYRNKWLSMILLFLVLIFQYTEEFENVNKGSDAFLYILYRIYIELKKKALFPSS